MDLLLSLELKTKSYSTFSICFFSPLFWTRCPPYNYVTIEQLTIKTNTRKVSIQKFDRMNFSQFFILENSSTHIEYMSMINRTYFAATLVQFWRLRNIIILKIFFQSSQICICFDQLTSKEQARHPRKIYTYRTHQTAVHEWLYNFPVNVLRSSKIGIGTYLFCGRTKHFS